LQIITIDPRKKREQRFEIAENIMASGGELVNPLNAPGLLFHIGIGGLDGEDRLAAANLLVQFISIVELDAEGFGQSVADLGCG